LLRLNAHGKKLLLEDDMQNDTTPLPFPLDYKGRQLLTVEDASAFVLNLSEEQRDINRWRAAHTAFSCALMEPAYLKTAVITLQLALTLDALVDPTLLAIPARLLSFFCPRLIELPYRIRGVLIGPDQL
jgi:hypothetical protein